MKWLHLFVLFGFAVAQPVFDLLGQNPEFFVAHRAGPMGMSSMVVLLSLGLPLVLCLLILAVRPLGPNVQRSLHIFLVWCLAVLIFLPLAKRFLPGGDVVVVTAAVTAGLVFTVFYSRLQPVQMLISVLAPAVLIFPLWFLVMTPVSGLVFPHSTADSGPVSINDPAPVVLVVLDELNTRALLDANGGIDRRRFPHFARLADQGYWFPNAVGAHIQTMHALPAILTGQQPKLEDTKTPTARDHPHNLFTLLGGQYNVNALESQTQLCPENICQTDLARTTAQSKETFWRDLGVIYLHIVVPQGQASRLPRLDGRWTGFTRTGSGSQDDPAGRYHGMDERAEQFESFLSAIEHSRENQVHFAHILLPHLPYTYLSTGHVYNRSINHAFPEGIKDEKLGWSHKDELVRVAYLQYLQQVGFVDRLLGKLFQRLEQAGLYDHSLIIVTADHGVSFQPGKSRRGISPSTMRDILKVPMLVKLPGQEEGAIDEKLVSGLDILPTIADVLGVEPLHEVDGRSVLATRDPHRTVIEATGIGRLKVQDIQGFPRLKWQVRHFGSGSSLEKMGSPGPFPELIGRRVSELPENQNGTVQFQSERMPYFEQVDPDSDFLPALFSGSITGTQRHELPLAVAMNGEIQATTKTSEWLHMERYFSALLPASAFEKGLNPVQLFLVHDTIAGPSLAEIPYIHREEDAVSIRQRANGQHILVIQDEAEIPLGTEPATIQGYVDHLENKGHSVLIRGWAGDEHDQPVKSIHVFQGRQFVAQTQPRVERPDVAGHLNKESMRLSGFRIHVPLSPKQDDLGNIRVIAVSKDNKARELQRTQSAQ